MGKKRLTLLGDKIKAAPSPNLQKLANVGKFRLYAMEVLVVLSRTFNGTANFYDKISGLAISRLADKKILQISRLAKKKLAFWRFVNEEKKPSGCPLLVRTALLISSSWSA
jgi:hypothetical protein